MTSLERLAVGLDLGNGYTKITIDGKTLTIVSGYTCIEPSKVLDANNQLVPGDYFSVERKGRVRYFGPAILAGGMPPLRCLDRAKLETDYIRTIFSAAVVAWWAKYGRRMKAISEYRLAVVAGMPPESYQDLELRTMYTQAYTEALNGDTHANNLDTPWYVGSSLLKGAKQRIYPTFLGIAPETTEFLQQTNIPADGYTVIGDIGHGTLDMCLMYGSEVVKTKTFPFGLVEYYAQLKTTNEYMAEYACMHNHLYADITEFYMRTLIEKLNKIVRIFPVTITTFILIGGGTNYVTPEIHGVLQRNYKTVQIFNGDSNSQAFWNHAKKHLATMSVTEDLE